MKFLMSLKHYPLKTIILSLCIWFTYSCGAIIINLWEMPGWLQSFGLLINVISLAWLVMTYFKINTFEYRCFNTLLLLWFGPAWIYLDATVFSPTMQVTVETLIVDISMLLLLTTANLFTKPTVVAAGGAPQLKEIKPKNNNMQFYVMHNSLC